MDLDQQTRVAIFNQKKNTGFPTKFEVMVYNEQFFKYKSVLEIAWGIEKTIRCFTQYSNLTGHPVFYLAILPQTHTVHEALK